MVLVEVGDDEPDVGNQAHMPAAFLRLLHSLQYLGQVIPAGTLFAALSAFQSAPQARSRAYSACRPSVGFLVAGAGFAAAVGATGVVAGAAAAGFAASPLHFPTYAFSVILAASFAVLLALHSSSQAFTVFFCASEGVEENARPEKITAEHTISTVRLFMSQLQFVPASFYVCFCANAAGRLQRFIESDIYGS
jgi:hypothetical protein